VHLTPTGNCYGGSRGILYEINQQYLRSKYKFKEGTPLKEYLWQRRPNLGDMYTLWEVLTWLKEIIRDNLLFDESNPAMIVGDAPLEAALGKKRVHVNEILGVVQQQLTMVEAGQGPLSPGMLAGGTVYEGVVHNNSRPEARGWAVTTQANTTNAGVLSLMEIAAGPVVLYSPAVTTHGSSARSRIRPHSKEVALQSCLDLRPDRTEGKSLLQPHQRHRTSQGFRCVC
jgi:hypothetical protein